MPLFIGDTCFQYLAVKGRDGSNLLSRDSVKKDRQMERQADRTDT